MILASLMSFLKQVCGIYQMLIFLFPSFLLHLFIGILYGLAIPPPSLIYLINYLYQDGLMNIYSKGYNPTPSLFILLFKLS